MNAIKRVWAGNAGLAKTYWAYGILGSLPWFIALYLMPPESYASVAVLFAFLAYSLVVSAGVWHAASSYSGPVTWAVLAKVVSVLGIVLGVVMLFSLSVALIGSSLEHL